MREIECKNKNCEFFEDHPCIVYQKDGVDCWDIETEWTCPVCKNKPRENRFSRLQTEIE